MFPLLINPLPLILTLTTSFGVLLHDTQIDRATITALTIPAIIASYGSADTALKASEGHTRTERVSVASGEPRVQPRGNDDKKYVIGKKFRASLHGSDYAWPIP